MTKRLNILLMSHEYPPVGGGGGNAARHLAKCLQTQNIDVTVLTSAFKTHPREETSQGVRIIRVPARRKLEAESSTASILAYAATAYIKSHRLPRPNLVHAFFGVPGGAVGYLLKQTLGLPYIISFRGKDVHGGKSRNFGGITGMLKAVSMPVWEAAEALVANSNGLREIARSVAPHATVEVVPNGVDAGRFTPVAGPRVEGPIRILFVGRLEHYKGVDTLLDALVALKQQTTRPFTLRIAGDGSLKAHLMAETHRLKLDDSVEFMGWIPSDQIPGVYQTSDIFVLPSVVEGMPNGVLESMATGLPSIASRVPGTEELIAEGETGITFAPGDTEALAAALKSLVEDDDARVRMGQAARLAAIERSWEEVAEQYAGLYDRVLGVSQKDDSRRATG